MGHETAASSSADNGYICSLKRHLQEVLKVGFGGAEGSRTPDLLIANETLYQLSYDPIHQRITRINSAATRLRRILCFRCRHAASPFCALGGLLLVGAIFDYADIFN